MIVFKKSLKSLVLVAIYCLGIFASLNATSISKVATQQPSNKEASLYSSASQISSLHTQQSEISISDLSEYSFSNIKVSCKDFDFDKAIVDDGLLQARFKQYNNLFTNLLIRYRKSNLIFPFHSFW